MSTPRRVPESISRNQWEASDPAISAFVAANAGSGKTHVLVQRVIRLLLSGTPPERILCITFTKAAAANMAQRIYGTLGRWIALDDAALDEALRSNGISHPGAKLRHRARELFARALETPGGLKVQTIHALCTRLLQQFPFEANVVAHFTVLEDRDRDEMLERARLAVLTEAAAHPDSATGRALATAMRHAADLTFRELLNEAVTARDVFESIDADQIDGIIADLCRQLGIPADLTHATLNHALVHGPLLPISEWESAAEVFATGSSDDQEQAERLRSAIKAKGDARIEHYLDLFFTKARGKRARLMTKKIADAHPSFKTRMKDECDRLVSWLDQSKALATRERTEAMLVLALQVFDHYRRAKKQRGALDYDDLIERTAQMLTPQMVGWVHYKLDRGIDHVLIDEAQDTSPKQWAIIESLIGEFTAGAGAREDVKRTLFAVGDDKQSIYSFHGAVTAEFDARRRHFAALFTHARLDWRNVQLHHSFRSGTSILKPIEQVFHDPDIYRSITQDRDGMPPHLALDGAPAGEVELWDLEPPAAAPVVEGWQAPFDQSSTQNPKVVLARKIAARVKQLIAERTPTGTGATRRPLAAGDVLILVRKRGAQFEAIIQALKQAGIDVAGADRLKLTDHIAVMDLMALGDALLLPEDDLALATVLKSPLFGLDDAHLMTLAIGRQGTLAERLEECATQGAPFSDAWNRWQRYRAQAARGTPFAFYAWVLGGDGGRGRILARLGLEANDALDEFLELAFAYERRKAASLQGFMHWLRAAPIEIKRDLEIARNEVRVMTVHGAKGLEAPVVILADTTSSPTERQKVRLLKLPRSDRGPDAAPILTWAAGKARDPDLLGDGANTPRGQIARDTEDEYRRLLYVAMTRAMERLIICGCMPGNRSEKSPGWWYTLIESGLDYGASQGTLLRSEADGMRCYRARDEQQPDMTRAADAADAAVTAATELPAWLHAPAPREAALPVWIRPSDGDAGPPRLAGAESAIARALARRRGVLMHRLLQSLPDLPRERRPHAAMRYLSRHAADLDEVARTTLRERVLAVLDDPRLTDLFAPGSRAEVPIVGKLEGRAGGVRAISGQIDRLAVTSAHVLIADFKTGQAPLPSAPPIPEAYRVQMALYRGLLREIYPGRPIRAVLIWTEGTEIIELSEAELDAELTRILDA